MSLIIAGERSGAGKTTITLALLAFLREQNLTVQSFKVGPDYIDPMFHQAITSRPCYNLDPVLTSETYIQQSFSQRTEGIELALVEGVMGLFDGVSTPEMPTTFASTAHIARLLQLPVVLVIDCSRLSGSVVAIAHGYRTLDPQLQIAGLILNRVASDRHLELLQNALEPLQIPILGILRRHHEITLPDRHLGLVPAEELPHLHKIFAQLAHLAKTCFDWQQLFPLLKTTPAHSLTNRDEGESYNFPIRNGNGGESQFPHPNPSLSIAIARDQAFNFYYPENLEILQKLGAELICWSPLNDPLPDHISGLYFGGGFPEMFAQTLSENQPALQAVHQAIVSGMPTVAECGGLMYLCQQIIDFEGNTYSGVGVLPATVTMSSRLTLGYRKATTLENSPLVKAGDIVYGHEFHRSQLDKKSVNSLYKMQRLSANSESSLEGWQTYQLHASYLHLHWGNSLQLPARFLKHCLQYQSSTSQKAL
jgi:cobyrinic acid a,c-diamide synthase